MPIRDWAPGDTPNGADLNRYFMQQDSKLKTADQTVTSSTTFVDDLHLFVNVQANTQYWVVAFLIYEAGTTGDLKIGWTAPAGAGFNWVSDSLPSTETTSTGTISRAGQGLGNTPAPAGVGAGSLVMSIPKGVLVVGSTSGTLRFRFAQSVSDPVASRVKANSLLMIRRLTS